MNDGAALNGELRGQLTRIHADVGRLGEVVAQIAGAGAQQDRGVEQLSNALEQINVGTQQAAANAEASASAAQQLAAHATRLQTIVAAFTLDSAAPADVAPGAAPRARTIAVDGDRGPPPSPIAFRPERRRPTFHPN